jgi:peptidoglycan hydrolase-like protein with peptidoglycan-binding domain
MLSVSAIRAPSVRRLPTLPTLREGAQGSSVIQLQQKLRAKGYSVAADGSFGPKTERAVKSFQHAKGLVADGVVGPKTWAALNAPGAVTPPSSGAGGTRVTGYVNGKPVNLSVSSVGNGKSMRSDAAARFNQMKSAASRAGITLSVNSGFRTMDQQRHLYSLYLQGKGNLAAKPGYSNHQGGRSADINVPGGYSGSTYKWLKTHAGAYGFKNDVRTEPWHWTFK